MRVWVAGCAGTTSKPKGVPLTHANLAASLANIRDTYELTPADRSLLVMPLFHVHGLMAGAAPPFPRGRCTWQTCFAVPTSRRQRGDSDHQAGAALLSAIRRA